MESLEILCELNTPKEDYGKRLEQELTRKGKEEDGSGRRRSRDAL